jgi:hypothetical protein
MIELTENSKHKAIRSLERRFGPSMSGYTFKAVKTPEGHYQLWRIVDDETGSWLKFFINPFRKRIVVREEHDAA